MRPIRGLLLGAILLLGLVGCQKVELYSRLSEQEGNEVLAVLLQHGIDVTKDQNKEFVSISVERERVSEAITILQSLGLPRETFSDLGDIFQKQGLISSPLEERVRYTYGLSQMLAEAINQIDGVLAARVLIVLPEDSRFGETISPSSASVFIKYQPGLGVEESIPKIKMLVQNSVERLDYANISVTIFPVSREPAVRGALPADGGSDQHWLVAAGFLLIIALVGNGYFLWRRYRGTRARQENVVG